MRSWTILNSFGQADGTIVETAFNTYFKYDQNGAVKGSAVKVGNMIIQYNAFGIPERTLVEVMNPNGESEMPSPINFFG